MKQNTRYPHLRIYHATHPEYQTAKGWLFLTQRSLDIATIVISLSGLFAAIIFLITM